MLWHKTAFKKKWFLAFPAGLRVGILTTWLQCRQLWAVERQYSLMIVMWPNPSNHSLYLNTVSDLTCQSFLSSNLGKWQASASPITGQLCAVDLVQLQDTCVHTHTQRYMHKNIHSHAAAFLQACCQSSHPIVLGSLKRTLPWTLSAVGVVLMAGSY